MTRSTDPTMTSAPPTTSQRELGRHAYSREELLAFYEGKTAKWQIPDDVVFVDAIPLGATGKMLKTRLREQLADYKLPGL